MIYFFKIFALLALVIIYIIEPEINWASITQILYNLVTSLVTSFAQLQKSTISLFTELSKRLLFI